jgi:hypothetical protein
MLTPPQIVCPELPAIETAELNAVIQAFRAAPACKLRQSWLVEPRWDFASATVRAGWREDSLQLLAELHDADIFTFARQPNERLWELGDTLEIFLRPAGQSAYAEFQVAPNNQRLQLQFANAAFAAETRKSGAFASALVRELSFQSSTWVRPDLGCWYALLEIPASSVSDNPHPLPGSEWHFSFCRYDYTRGCPEPVISSTSAHSRPDFHRQEEWGAMRFTPRQPIYETVNFDNFAGQPG